MNVTTPWGSRVTMQTVTWISGTEWHNNLISTRYLSDPHFDLCSRCGLTGQSALFPIRSIKKLRILITLFTTASHLNHINPIHTHQPNFSRIYFNIILTSTQRVSRQFFYYYLLSGFCLTYVYFRKNDVWWFCIYLRIKNITFLFVESSLNINYSLKLADHVKPIPNVDLWRYISPFIINHRFLTSSSGELLWSHTRDFRASPNIVHLVGNERTNERSNERECLSSARHWKNIPHPQSAL